MKKFMKIVAIVAAMTMLAGIACAADYTATIGYADTDWSNQDWESSVAVTGDGTYTVSTTAQIGAEGIETTPEGIVVFVIDLAGVTTDLLAAHGLTADDLAGDTGAAKAAAYADKFGIEASIDSIKVDGVEVALDNSKLIIGDIENKGNLRLEIWNEYGDTKTAGGVVDPASIVFAEKMDVTFTIKGLDTALTGVKYEPSTDAGTDAGTDNQPATGDATSIVVLAMVAMLAFAGVVVSKKRA